MQLCDEKSLASHIFVVVVTSNGTFSPIQEAIRSWTEAKCLSFEAAREFPWAVTYTTPPFEGSLPISTASNFTMANSTTAGFPTGNSTSISPLALRRGDTSTLLKRADCRSVQAAIGTGCPELAIMCGVSPNDFEKFNPSLKCDSVKPKQWVCCSTGTLPDRRPKPGADGKCASYAVQDLDNCDSIAAENGLTRKELGDLNKKTWGFSGCEPLFSKAIICLSEGNPPSRHPSRTPPAVPRRRARSLPLTALTSPT